GGERRAAGRLFPPRAARGHGRAHPCQWQRDVARPRRGESHWPWAVRRQDQDRAGLITPREGVAGIRARNREQAFALDLLLDDSVKLVTLLGMAGTGKTLLALAAGLSRVVEEGAFSRLLISRPVMPMGRDIGFLPGDIDEKLAPWMQPLYDNLEYLLIAGGSKRRGMRGFEDLLDSGQIQVEPLT